MAAMQERIRISPLARRLAKEAGLDLEALSGSGPHGRIIKRDVETALSSGAARQTVASGATHREVARTGPAPAALADDKILALYDKGSYELVPHDKMRRVIAERLTVAKQTIPHYYLSIDCRIDELMRARERMNAASPADGPRAYKLSVNDFIIKAMALALQDARLRRHRGRGPRPKGPIFLSLLHDTCGQCDRTIAQCYRDPEFVRYCNENMVVVLGHQPWDADDRPHAARPDGSCTVHPGLTCREHEELYRRGLAVVGGFRTSPGNFVLDPFRTEKGAGGKAILGPERSLPKWGDAVEEYLAAFRGAAEVLRSPGR